MQEVRALHRGGTDLTRGDTLLVPKRCPCWECK